MRPHSIILFERLFLASLAISVVGFVVTYDDMVEQLSREPALVQVGLGSGFATSIFVAGMAIYLLLWFLIARKAVGFAKWVLVVLILLSLSSLPGILAAPFTLPALLNLAVLALELAALYYLFRPDARAWFAGETPADPDTFD